MATTTATATNKQVKLTSNDGVEFEVDIKVAECSKTLKTMLDDLGVEENEDVNIPLPNVNGKTLAKVIEWCNHHKDDVETEEEHSYKSNREDKLFTAWDADYLRVDENTLFELVLAANYLDIDGLLNLTCKAVANTLRGKTAEECREKYGIVNDFTPEEEEQILKENKWCEDT